jgi:steroid 5-alpha reductase family enzyme
MSSSSESQSWVDTWWPLLVILYGVLFVTVLVTFSPTT